MAKPWYHEGLRFTCTQCGDCCTGDPGNVWVDDAEVAAMAERVGLCEAEFRKQYCRKVRNRWSLVEVNNGDCVFFDPQNRSCQVYDLRPKQCGTWPFWSSNLQSPEDWEATCRFCPGSGQGKLHTLEEIVVQRNRRLM